MRRSCQFVVVCTITASVLVGCSTTGRFVIPEGTQLEIGRRLAEVRDDGWVVVRPFSWSSAGIPPDGGIPYRLLKEHEVVQEGLLRAKFRAASIFWPPYAGLFMWPIGLNSDITYDLIRGTQE